MRRREADEPSLDGEQLLRDNPKALAAAMTLFGLAAKHGSSEEIERLRVLAETDKQAFFVEFGMTHQQARQLYMDLGVPVEHPEIDADAWANFDPDEPYGWLRLAGKEPTKEEIERSRPTEAFAKHVLGDDDKEAQSVLDTDTYEIPSFIEALDRLAVSGSETNQFDDFESLCDFVLESKYIFPRQFPELVMAISHSKHPITRGSASYCLPSLMEVRPREATEIWQRLLQDPEDPRVVDAAVMVYDLEMHPEYRVGQRLGWRQRHALDKLVSQAKKKLKLASYPRSIDLDHND